MPATTTAPTNDQASGPASRELTFTRDFNAPRDLVFRLWTDAEHISNWWGPNGFTTTTYQMDVRPGGVWRFTMHGPDGTDYANSIVYREVIEPEYLKYDHYAGDATAPPHFHATVSFTSTESKTRVTLNLLFPSVEEFNNARAHGAVEGGQQTLARFEQLLAKSLAEDSTLAEPALAEPVLADPALYDLFITRVFDAPRKLVYEAFSNPEHAKKWMGPRGFTATHFEQDARPGGSWRACLHQTGEWGDQTYPDLWQGGIFKEIVPPERIVYTFAWEGQGGQSTRETLITIRFTQVEGDRTRMDFHQAFFDSLGERDGHNTGWNSSFDRLNDYVKENSRQLATL